MVARGPVLILVLVGVVLTGCGGGGQDDAPVRALMDRYVQALTRHDWAYACAQLTPEAAEQRRLSTPYADGCPSAEAFDAGEGFTGDPHIHPERAGEELLALKINRIVMHGDRAQIWIVIPPDRNEVPFLAVRRAGQWLLAQDLEVGIPVDSRSGTLY